MNKISIAMANYNCGEFIKESIDSILSQTYKDWELIIVDDASTDNSLEIIDGYKDARIKVIPSSQNEGLAASLNKAFAVVDGNYLARLDPDDVALPERFEKQMDFFADNSSTSVCGSNIIQFGDVDKYITKMPSESEKLWAYIPFGSPLAHSTWMINLSQFESIPFYNSEYRSSQDYELMFRLWKEEREIRCIKEPLVKYRIREGSISNNHKKHRDPNTKKVQKRVMDYIGIDAKDEDIDSLNFDFDISRGNYKGLKDHIRITDKLIRSNIGDKYFSQTQLKRIIHKGIIVNSLKVMGFR